jgi:Asp-tRNA(Asn)/Glu-tRNA(Gln) amidotransferase C subunit
MTHLAREETVRIARLARLELAPDEAARLGAQVEAITREFSSLQAYAATLPEPDAEPAAPPREDEAAPADREMADAILRASARFEPGERAIRARRA